MLPQDTALPADPKACRGCGVLKARTEYRPGRNYCRLCERAKDAERRRTNGDALRSRHRDYYHGAHERYLAYSAKERAKRREQRAAAERERRRCHPDRVRAASLRWKRAHPEKVRQMQRDWKAAQGPAYRAHYQGWWATYYPAQRERYLVNAGNRRALKRRAQGSYSRADLALLRATQRGCCAYCGSLLLSPMHVDHMTPLSRGGSNWPANLALACATCNLRKGRKNAGEFLAYLLKQPPRA